MADGHGDGRHGRGTFPRDMPPTHRLENRITMFHLTLSRKAPSKAADIIATVEVPESHTCKVAKTSTDVGTFDLARFVAEGLLTIWNYGLKRYGRDGCVQTVESRDEKGQPIKVGVPNADAFARKAKGLYGEEPILSRGAAVSTVVRIARQTVIKVLGRTLKPKAVTDTGIGRCETLDDVVKLAAAHGITVTDDHRAKWQAAADLQDNMDLDLAI